MARIERFTGASFVQICMFCSCNMLSSSALSVKRLIFVFILSFPHLAGKKGMRTFNMTAVALSGLLLLAACVRQMPELPEDVPVQESGRVRIVVAEPLTKAGGVIYDRDEKPVGRWAFFLFDHSSGRLACRGEVTDGRQTTKQLRTGEYDLEVIANYPVSGQDAVDVSTIASRADFNALKVSLGQNISGAFVMAGTPEDASGNRIPFRVVSAEGGDIQEADIRLKRLVSKVVVSGLTRQFVNASLAAKPLTVKGIYLTNIYTEARYGADYTLGELGTDRSLWYNALGWHKDGSAPVSERVDALVGERDLNLSLAQGETVDLSVSLYFFPNPMLPSRDVPSSEWKGTARCTRLVVWVQVEGRDYYYPATLPKEDVYAPIGRNSVYSVHCTLTALGSTEEDDWVSGAMEVTFEPVLLNDGAWERTDPVTEES